MVNLTEYVPAAGYCELGLRRVDVFPLPKSHEYVREPGPLERLLKLAVKGGRQSVLTVLLKSAFTPDTIRIYLDLPAVLLQPVLLVTVRETE